MKKSLLITFIFAVFLFGIHYFMNISNHLPDEFSKRWNCVDREDAECNSVFDLPVKFKNLTNIKIQRQLPEILDKTTDTLFFYTSEQCVAVFIDDTQIYEYGMEKDTRPFMKSPAALWHKVKLEKSYEGKKLSLFFSYPYKKNRGKIFKVYLSNYQNFNKYLMKKYFLGLEFGILCLVFPLVVSPLCWVFRKYKDKIMHILCICIFSVLAAVWYISDNKLIIFVTSYPKVLFMMSILSLMFINLPSLIYAVNIKDLKLRSFLLKVIIAFSITYFVLIILEFFSVIDIYVYRSYVHLGIYVSALTYYITLGISLIRDKRKDVKLPFLAYLFLIAGSSIDFFIYLTDEEQYSASYASFSALVFITFLFVSAVNSLHKMIEQNKKAILHKDLASKDFMTGTKNKSSFLSDTDKAIVSEKVAVIVFDINNLKYINEEFGHEKGDEACIKVAELIKNVFLKYGDCYRTGTDEFSVLIQDCTQLDIYELLQKFIEVLNYENNNLSYKLGTAMGFAVFNPKIDNKLKDTIDRAKDNMIKNKASQKFAENSTI